MFTIKSIFQKYLARSGEIDSYFLNKLTVPVNKNVAAKSISTLFKVGGLESKSICIGHLITVVPGWHLKPTKELQLQSKLASRRYCIRISPGKELRVRLPNTCNMSSSKSGDDTTTTGVVESGANEDVKPVLQNSSSSASNIIATATPPAMEQPELPDILNAFGNEGVRVSVAEVEIELNDELKQKLVQDLSSICSVDEAIARQMLETNKWNMQRAIDGFFDAPVSDEEEDCMIVSDEGDSPNAKKVKPEVVTLDDVTSPEADSKKEKESEIERTAQSSSSESSKESFSSWAPEKLSVMSWNVDGLDDKNLEKRTDAVIEIVLKENHDIVFFQELLPYTFDYIARKLCSKYMPIPGTEDPTCDYLTGTFIKLNTVHYEDHYIIPFPNTAMQRNLLVTKVFIGQAKIALLNTHLESTKEFSSQRKVQLKQCFEIMKSFPSEYNVLFGGDLNLRDSEVEGLIPRDTQDLWISCGARDSCKYTWDLTRNTNKQVPARFQPRCRFDRFYFRNSNPATLDPEFFGVTGIEKVLATQSFPSDHWAIITFFRLSKEARKPSARKRKSEAASVSK